MGAFVPYINKVIWTFKYKAGVLGFEPRNGETKTRCLTTWRHPIAFTFFIITSLSQVLSSIFEKKFFSLSTLSSLSSQTRLSKGCWWFYLPFPNSVSPPITLYNKCPPVIRMLILRYIHHFCLGFL